MTSPVENHSQERTADTADLSTTLRSGRDDKGEGGASIERGCRTDAIFHHLGRPEGPLLLRSKNISRKGPLTPQISPLRSFGAPVEMTKGRAALPLSVVAEQKLFFITLVGRKPMTSAVEMTKGRAALPRTVVAEQDPFFIALGGPKAHDSSGRDEKGRA